MSYIQKIKGTNDILPDHLCKDIFKSGLWQKLETIALNTARNSGYHEIRTPIFEATELFVRGLGDLTDIVNKEMFNFTDRGERKLTLRPEGTASIVRAWIENRIGQSDPVARLSYLGPMFRAERPQKGRYRQFHQFGIECIGGGEVWHDVEVISVFWQIIKDLGIKRVKLLINSVGCPECLPGFRERLKEVFSPRLDELCSDCQTRYQGNILRMLDCKNAKCQPILDSAPAIINHLCPTCADFWDGLKRGLDAIKIEWHHAPRLVRGLDYYTKTAFEIVHDSIGAQGTIIGGGRYDGLIEASGGPAQPAVGGAFGIERMLLALEAEGLETGFSARPRFYLVKFDRQAEPELLRLLFELRKKGIHALRPEGDRNLKKQIGMASKSLAQEVVFVGGDEWQQNQLVIKNLDSGQQETIKLGQQSALDYLVERARS